MADKIDIEEHDITENPTIKDKFPNLSATKKEMTRYYDTDLESTSDTKLKDTGPVIIEIEDTEAEAANSKLNVDTAENKLLHCNRIILGSKPNKVSVDQNYFEKCVKPYQANVVLQDIQSYLQKSKRYCEICYTLFPEPSDYENHSETFHCSKNFTDTSQNIYFVKHSSENRCGVCASIFATSALLKNHIENCHNARSLKDIIAIESSVKNVSRKMSNTCFHCKEKFETQKALIDHLYDILQMKKKNTEIVPVLKSVLFKCNKCDINFVYSQVATRHNEHMEMLINWKCSICYRIFKKEDELSHERQHSVSNNFVTYNLGEVDADKIMFKCLKCSTHFTEHNFLYHFRDCGLKTFTSVYCMICNIFLAGDIVKSHENGHYFNDFNINKFTVIETEVISDNPVKATVKKGFQMTRKEIEIVQICSEVKVILHRLDANEVLAHLKSNEVKNYEYNSRPKSQESISAGSSNSDKVVNNDFKPVRKIKMRASSFTQPGKKDKNINKTRKRNEVTTEKKSSYIHRKRPASTADNQTVCKKPNLSYSYCEVCKCFITRFRKNVHIQSLCMKLGKQVCKHCGLTFTPTSMMTHRRLHQQSKDFKLKDFSFYNLYTGQRMNPPIPEYPKCVTCGVQFLTRISKNNHACREEAYLTCHICEMKLSEAAFKLHMMFHHYSVEDTKNTSQNYVQAKKKLGTDSYVNNSKDNEMSLEQSLQHKCDNYVQAKNNLDTDDDVNNFKDNEISLEQSPQHRCDNYVQVKNNVDTDANGNNFKDNEMSLEQSPKHSCDELLQRDLSGIVEFVYTCKNCNVSVGTYDKVVEHCQGHYNSETKEIETEMCNVCTLQIDKTCYPKHYNLHEKGNKLKVLEFDSYYFPEENDLWVRHVFKSVPQEKVVEILSKSIYRLEGRIKMDVIQHGSSDLTVYKCDRCSCFIEPSSLYKHADNSCFKLRKHPCTFCGLPFISSATRIEHEKIHKRPGITCKSYRIVLFNREEDKQLNSSFYFRKRYVLYQCRSCGGIIDKLQSDVHVCDISDLKKCSECALLLYNKDYKAHATAHKEFDSFNHKNMKVIILGELKTEGATAEKLLKPNFQGTIYDYQMFRCNKCQLCIKNEKCIPKHSCYFGKPQCKCPKCHLYFSVSRLKTHMRSHERDPDYLRTNMSIISFDPCSYDQNENTNSVSETGGCELSDSTDSDSDIVINVEERNKHANEETSSTMTDAIEVVKVFKCTCGLHFLNEDSILRHFGVCNPQLKAAKLNCPKCDLLFTSNVLFTHLLAHHNKSRHYTYDIVEMAKKSGF